jgi:hypothetical protein
MNNTLYEVTDAFLEDYSLPYHINDGRCEEWADEVFDKLKNSDHQVEIWATPFGFADTMHIFLRIDGKFYDVECLVGADDHMDLPIFKNLMPKRQSVWLVDHNGKKPILEDKRDMTDADVEEYHKENN